jgi:galactokinase
MSLFQQLFGHEPAVHTEAPGRVNLIGEHTDYNGGFVLPTTIPQRTFAQLAPRKDRTVRASSANMTDGIGAFTLGDEKPGHGWLDYVQGATKILHDEGFSLGGFDVLIRSEIPVGSGLSSSAALSISLFRALRTAFDLTLDDRRIAHLAQRVENQFVGAQVGIMDPMACSLGEASYALFLDTHTLTEERVPLPANIEWIVINSGVAHDHSAGDYNSRRAECEKASTLLGVRQLRDLGLADLPRVAKLPEPLNRRARHVITENARVLDAVRALKAGDLIELGRLFRASHDSQRDDYQVSVPAVDLLVELAAREPDVYGARLTGGGFGGSIVLFAKAGRGREVAERITRVYSHQSGHQATVLVPLCENVVAGDE